MIQQTKIIQITTYLLADIFIYQNILLSNAWKEQIHHAFSHQTFTGPVDMQYNYR